MNQISEFEKLFIRYLKQAHAGLLAEFAAGHWHEELEKDLRESVTRFLDKLYQTGFLKKEEEELEL